MRVRSHNRADRERLRGETSLGGRHDLAENSAEDVIGEIGLVLVITLGAALALNMILLALHIG
ncbi:MAG TPA: hypothetical protein VMF67_03845 [Rhizomicrobium sp.]|nr:hypothetical protein [Rhizomicrobium sp.]